MADLSIGDAVGAGFELIRRKPLAVISWGLVELVFAALMLSLFGSVFLDLFSQSLANARSAAGSTAPGAISTPINMMQEMARVQSANLLMNLGSLLVQSVVGCAVFRAVLHPERSQFAYLRLGAAELFVGLLTFAAVIAAVIGMIVPILVISIIAGVLVAMHAAALGIVIGIVGGIGLFVVLIYVALRLSLVAPMIVEDDKFHLFDAWALTRRHAGALFVIALCVVAILIVAEIAIGLVMVVTGVGFLSAMPGGLSNLPNFFKEPPAQILAGLSPLLVIGGLISVPLSGCSHAILAAPWARAYRDLAGPDAAATFS